MSATEKPPVRSNAPDPDKVPGYPERQPRDREEAQRDAPKPRPDPDDGGLDREPEGSPDPAKD